MDDTKRAARDERKAGAEQPTGRTVLGDSRRIFRADLVHGAFALRPMRPLPEDTPWLERVPSALRRTARGGHRIAVLTVAVLVFAVNLVPRAPAANTVLASLVLALPVAMLALRPVGAYWLSLGSLLLAPMVYPQLGGQAPYGIPALAAHLTVLLHVAWRSRARTALLLWLTTSAVAGIVSINFPRGGPGVASEPGELAFLYGGALLLLVSLRAWRSSQQQVAEHSAAVREERSLRARLEERAVIARELHDVVAHHMSVVAIQAEAAPYRVQDPPDVLVKALATIRENALTALAELRRVLGVVRAEQGAAPEAPQPTLAELDGLVANLRASGRDAELVTTGSVRPLPPGLELSAYRIVQESLSNVLRHAPEAAVRVELAYVLGGLGIRVANEAPGRPPAGPSRGTGQGLRGMRERVALLGGELTAGERVDGGWDVEAYLPVEPVPSLTGGPGARTADGGTEAGA